MRRVAVLWLVCLLVVSAVTPGIVIASPTETARGDWASGSTSSTATSTISTRSVSDAVSITNLTSATATTGNLLPESITSADWAFNGHDAARSRHNLATAGPKSAPSARWIHSFTDVANGDSSTIVADGRVLVAGDDGLRVLNNETGVERWNATGFDVRSISVSDGIVVTTSDWDDEIRTFYVANGTELWNKTSFEAQASVIVGGTLYVGRGTYRGSAVYAIDLRSGTEQWSTTLEGELTGGMAADADTLYITGVASGVTDRDSAVFALNRSSGRERWKFEIEGTVTMAPTVVNGTVYVGGGDETYDPKFYALDATDGHVEWIHDVNTRPRAAAVANGHVYVSMGHTLRALDVTTGEEQWHYRLPGSLDYGLTYTNMWALAPGVADGVVYVSNDRGYLVALDGRTGAEKWSYQLAGQATTPTIADDRIYIRTISPDEGDDGYTRIYALEENPFQFSGFTVPQTTTPGDQFTVSATVKNVDDETREYNLSLMGDPPLPVHWQTLDTDAGTLDPGQSVTLTFTAQLHTTGAWNLSLKRALERQPAISPVTVDVNHAHPVDAWPMGEFNASRTAANPNTVAPTQHLQERWNISDYNENTTPIIANGTVYAIIADSRYYGVPDIHNVTAYDAETGASHWSYNFTADNRIPAGSAAVANGTVYVVTTPFNFDESYGAVDEGSVYAFNATTGAVEWTRQVSINVSTYRDHGPIVADGRVYLAGDVHEENDYYDNASIVALDASDGTEEWSYHLGERALRESFITYAAGDGYVFVTVSDEAESRTYDDELYAFDAATGALVWTTGATLVVDQGETPVVADSRVFVIDRTVANGNPAEELVALDVATGAEEWRFTPDTILTGYDEDLGWELRKPAVVDSSLYVRQQSDGSMNAGRLYRVDAATGTATWNTSTGYLAEILVADGVIYGAETNLDPGYTRLYDAETGELLGHTGQGLSRSVANGTLYAYDDWSQRLRALQDGAVIEYSDLTVSAHRIDIGSNVTVTATATNVGTLNRSYDVNLMVAPDDSGSHYIWNYSNRDGMLAPGESTTITWVVSLRQRGDFVFTLLKDEGADSMERYMYDRTGSATVNVGDARDGQTIPLGGPRDTVITPDSWPTDGLNPANTGNRSEPGPTDILDDPVVWSVNATGEWSSAPVVAASTVFVGEESPDYVSAYHTTDGTLRWQYESSSQLTTTPTYAGGYVYAVTSDDRLYQINATSGERLWTFNRGEIGGLTIVSDTIYLTSAFSEYVDGETYEENTLYALNATTREIRWAFELDDQMPVTPAVFNGTVYVASTNGRAYAIDSATGTAQWSQQLSTETSVSVTSPVVDAGSVYVGADDQLFALDSATGIPTWQQSADFDGSSGVAPALADETLYFGGDGQASAIDATSGDYRWNTTVCAPVRSAPAVADGVIYLNVDDGTTYAFDGLTGDQIWRFQVGTEADYAPAVVDGRLYVTSQNDSSYDHALYALEGGSTSIPKTFFEYSSLAVSSPTVSTGQPLTITATVENVGDATCTYTADLKINDTVVDMASSELSDRYYNTETVAFTHTFASEGTYNVTIEDLPPIEVTVTGPQPEVDVTPASHDFGEVTVGSMPSETITVSNQGPADLDLIGATVTGPNASSFFIDSDPFGSYDYLWWGGSRSFYVYFTPTDPGTKTATLEVYTNDSDESTVNVSLSGYAVAEPGDITVTPQSHTFDAVSVGIRTTTNLTVQNDGDDPLTITDATFSLNEFGAYDVVAGDEAIVLAPGETHELTVGFTPAVADTHTATLVIESDDPDESSVTVELSGSGLATPVPDIAVDRLWHNYGDGPVGETVTTSFTIYNNGTAPLNVTDTTLVGTDASEFAVLTATPFVVAPGDTATVDLAFTPTSPGTKFVGLRVYSNDTDETPLQISEIGGTGVEPTAVTYDFTVEPSVTPADQNVTVNVSVTNNGGEVTDYSIGVFVDTVPAAHRSGTVAAGSTRYETFSFRLSPTEHVIRVNDLAGQQVLVVPTTDSGNVTVDAWTIRNTSVTVGESVAVEVQLRNDGPSAETYVVPLYTDGVLSANRTVTVPTGSTANVTLQTVFTFPGPHRISVDTEYPRTIDVTTGEDLPDPGDGPDDGKRAITNVSITHVNGTAPDTLPYVEAWLDEQPMVQLNLRSSEFGEYDLIGLGVDRTTEFRIDFTVREFTPRLLLGAGNVSRWETNTNEDGTTTVSVWVRPIAAQEICDFEQYPSGCTPDMNNWPTGPDDRATDRQNATVSLALDNLAFMDESARSRLTGGVMTTDAQAFGSPEYRIGESGRPALSLFVAGPHLTVAGEMNHGFYEAFLPNAVLSEWGVSDPAQLRAAYAGADTEFEVTRTATGWWMRVPLHYSSGSVVVSSTETDAGPDVDETPPTVEITEITGARTDGSTVYANQTLDVEIHAVDETNTVSSVLIALTSQQTSFRHVVNATKDEHGNWTAHVDLSAIPDDGHYTVMAAAVDTAANTNVTAADTAIIVDRSSPHLGATVTRIDASTARVDLAVTEPLADDTLTVRVAPPASAETDVSMTAVGDGQWTGTFAIGENGRYTVTASGTDVTGNPGSDQATSTFRTISTENRTVTVLFEPSGTFIRFNTTADVTDTFVTITESDAPLAPLTPGMSGASFLNGQLGTDLADNLSNATIGIPVGESQLPLGRSADEFSIGYYNEVTGKWESRATQLRTVTFEDGTNGTYWVTIVNHFSTYAAVATDETAPTITGRSPDDGYEYPAGTETATLTVDYADNASGVNVSAVTVRFDGVDVTDSGRVQITSSGVTYEASELVDGSNHTLSVTVVDHAGNAVTETLSVSIGTPASYTVSNATLDRTTVEEGESVHVTADVTNDGGSDGTFTATLLINRTPVTETDVAVASGATESISFTHAFPTAGQYDVSLSGVSAGTVVVTASDDGDGGSVPQPETETETETTTTTATKTATETTAPTSTETKTTTATNTSPTPSTEPTDDATEVFDGQPGFGASITIVALLAALLLRYRRDE